MLINWEGLGQMLENSSEFRRRASASSLVRRRKHDQADFAQLVGNDLAGKVLLLRGPRSDGNRERWTVVGGWDDVFDCYLAARSNHPDGWRVEHQWVGKTHWTPREIEVGQATIECVYE